MFDIRPQPEPLPQSLLDRAVLAEPATIGHFRLRGFPAPVIRPIVPVGRVAGTAVTLCLPAADSTLLHHAAGLVGPGQILVIDRLGDRHHACLGGGVALCLARAGIAGVIVDGPCADPHEIRACGLPVWASGISSITTRVQGIGGAMNVPVSVAGAVVMPGDLVIADEGGVVVLPPDEAGVDIERAIEMQSVERKMLPGVSQARPLGTISGATELVVAKLFVR